MALQKAAAKWALWDEPQRQAAVVHWSERDIAVVFPLRWARRRQSAELVAIAKDRIAEVEGKSGRTLVAGSVLLAFSRHTEQPTQQQMDPDVPKGLMQ